MVFRGPGMPMRRVVRPRGAPLLRGMLMGGAAYAAGRAAARGAQREEEQDAAIQDLQAEQAPPPAPAAPSGAVAPSIAEQLADLGRMAQQGLLTPEEFAAAKSKLLNQ